MQIQQYIGKVVQLIYNDSKRNVTIRNVRVLVAGDQRFLAYCYQAKAVRTFNVDGVVDMEVSRWQANSKEMAYSNRRA